MRLGGQVRSAGRVVTGWDMTAALTMAGALGVSPRLAAELLPGIEAVMVRKVNEQIGSDDV